MSFAVRRLNPGRVAAMSCGAAPMDVAGPTPPWSPPEHPSSPSASPRTSSIIRRLGGKATGLKTAFGARDNREVSVEGSAGLRTRYAIDPDKLIADIREVERVCREENPDPLEFVDHVQPVTDPDTVSDLDGQLMKNPTGLGRRRGRGATSCRSCRVQRLKHYQAARSHTVKVGERDLRQGRSARTSTKSFTGPAVTKKASG